MNVLIDALVLRYIRALAANSTDVAFADLSDVAAVIGPYGGVSSVPAVITPPPGYDMAPFAASAGHAALRISPFATGGAGSTFSFRVMGWSLASGDSGIAVWHPELLYQADCITSNKTGIAGHYVLDTEFYCSQITETFGNPNVSCETLSPGTILAGNQNSGHVCVDAKGSRILTVQFQLGTATSANALIRPF